MAGVGFFDVPSCADLPAPVSSTSGMALPKDKLESEVVVAGTQVVQEERVTGDTPPGHLGCAVPVAENDLLRASRVKFDTLLTGVRTFSLLLVFVCSRRQSLGVRVARAAGCWRPWTACVALFEALSGSCLVV